MSDDFGTVNIRRGDRAREIEILRQQYRHHRETLTSLASDAPTEYLAGEYARMIHEIDKALLKLDELEGRVPQDTQPMIRTDSGGRAVPTAAGLAAGAAAAAAGEVGFQHRQTEAGARPLVSGPAVDGVPDSAPNQASRLVLIVLAGIVVLAIIGWLLWRASGDRRSAETVREQSDTAATAAVTETVAPVTPLPQPVAAALTIAPAANDYGTIRKGTRAVRQFQITNTTAEPLTVQVARSKCRCLYYDYSDKLAPGKKETITVTVDGAKAKSGALHETLTVSSKADPTITASFEVNAEIK